MFRIDNYLEMYSVRDEDDLAFFQTEQAREGAKLFARRLLAAMEAENQLRGLLDGEGKLTGFPAKRKKKMYALLYLAEKLEPGRDYSERELGEALRAWHTFHDPATLRRELYDAFFLDRDPGLPLVGTPAGSAEAGDLNGKKHREILAGCLI